MSKPRIDTNVDGIRTVCVVLVDRANYGRLKPVMHALAAHPALRLQVVVGGSMVLERFNRPVDIVRHDGFHVDSEVFTELEGSQPTTMARSIGIGIGEFANTFYRLQPDFVLLIGDRYEALSAAIAAAYMNLPLVHIQGGEVSGSIDESARHAITKFAQFHVPATQRAADYLIRMGERPETILTVGCPSSDIARQLDRLVTPEMINARGMGVDVDPAQPFLLSIFHPTTTEYGQEEEQMLALLHALHTIHLPTVLLWPNIDAGSEHINKTIRRFRDQHDTRGWLRTRINMEPETYLKVLAQAACAVGNSSSFVRDASFFGTPVVLVGHRQDGRETDAHALRLPCEAEALVAGIRQQLAHGQFAPSTLYGDGHVAERTADAIAMLQPYVQKRLAYAD